VEHGALNCCNDAGKVSGAIFFLDEWEFCKRFEKQSASRFGITQGRAVRDRGRIFVPNQVEPSRLIVAWFVENGTV
jgi:hypothetical protein